MNFSYADYRNLINKLKASGYSFVNYGTCDEYEKCVILRHDIDYSLDKSVKMAQIEAEEGITSTYFVLLTSEFYNVLSSENIKKILTIYNLGHSIGLHFDEMNYTANEKISVEELIIKEAELLEKVLGIPIKSVSMHRPSKATLEADYQFETLINSYGKKFFKDFKYVSDSRRRWRENVGEIVSSGAYEKLHILTHAFWYGDEDESIETAVANFVFSGNKDRYNILGRNITDLESILKKETL